MKKGLFTKMKDWFKDYYKELSVSMKQDKTLSQLSWGVIIAGAFTSFAFLLANPAGGAFMASALLTGVAFVDMYSNVMQGNNTSYLMRGIMYVGMTALAPVVAAAEYGIEKYREHREYKKSADKGVILDKPFECDTPNKDNKQTLDSNTSEFVSQRHTYEDSISTPTQSNVSVESSDKDDPTL